MRHASRGFSLIELVVALAILSAMVMASGTYFGEFIHNAKLREAGNTLYSEMLMAQSEAVKRNARVRLVVSATVVNTVEVATNTTLRSFTFSGDVSASAATIVFGSDGRPTPFGGPTAVVNLAKTGVTCSADVRCPGLRIDAGGATRLCASHLVNCT